ncbi:hypothetical protein SY88_17945 [Clostridiales bacterium PH28_bin88]|nr:hypothetical protein SY88_17945 [Clostridiales bacterium PH28_bin88]
MFGLLPSVGPWELVLILALALIIFGPGKLPEVGRSLGKGMREFNDLLIIGIGHLFHRVTQK